MTFIRKTTRLLLVTNDINANGLLRCFLLLSLNKSNNAYATVFAMNDSLLGEIILFEKRKMQITFLQKYFFLHCIYS